MSDLEISEKVSVRQVELNRELLKRSEAVINEEIFKMSNALPAPNMEC